MLARTGHALLADLFAHVPSTGEYCPYVHIFFRMADGSYIAFFDLGDGKATVPDAGTPAWVNHIALEVGSRAELLAAKATLEANGVSVLGPTDHGFVNSIYFFDPNGFRVELTCWTAAPGYMVEAERQARGKLAAWTEAKRAAIPAR